VQPPVLFEERDGIAIITLNRPDNRNSMTPELLACFAEVVKEVGKLRGVRAVVITGKGRCFSAGADFRSTVQTGSEALMPHERSYAMYEPFLKVLDLEPPVIGALNGHAVGGGFGLSLLCDIRIANREAKYGANFARLGLHPGLGIGYTLPRLVGFERASEMLYTGRLVLGEEAERIGLVLRAVDGDSVLREATALAETIAANAPIAIRLTKRSLREHLELDIRKAAHREAFAQAETLGTKDAAEGMGALLAKRDPHFKGE
jgi:enoyl-CoA hydratase/carnithine racemase